MSAKEKALALISGIRTELANGTKHYNQHGYLLVNEKEILECLLTEGRVVIEQVERGKEKL